MSGRFSWIRILPWGMRRWHPIITPKGELGRASEYFSKAFELRTRASEREKLTITADFYQNVTGELGKAEQTFEE